MASRGYSPSLFRTPFDKVDPLISAILTRDLRAILRLLHDPEKPSNQVEMTRTAQKWLDACSGTVKNSPILLAQLLVTDAAIKPTTSISPVDVLSALLNHLDLLQKYVCAHPTLTFPSSDVLDKINSSTSVTFTP